MCARDERTATQKNSGTDILSSRKKLRRTLKGVTTSATSLPPPAPPPPLPLVRPRVNLILITGNCPAAWFSDLISAIFK